RHGEADIVGAQAGHATVVVLGHHGGDAHVAPALPVAPGAHARQGVALVDDVVDQQHATAAQRGGRAMLPHQFTTGGGTAVAGGVQVVELEVQAARADLQCEVGGERQAAVHHGQEQRPRAVGVVGDDAPGHRGDRAFYRRAVVDHLGAF